MTNIITWPKHLFHSPRDHVDLDSADTCTSCILGSYCKTCRGAEGDLPTDCPGRPMTSEEMDSVMREQQDYIHCKGWITPQPRRKY